MGKKKSSTGIRMVFVLILETTALLDNLVFNISFFPEQFNVDRLPYCLYIPLNSFQIGIS